MGIAITIAAEVFELGEAKAGQEFGQSFPEIDALVERAVGAARDFMFFDQEQVDRIVQSMAMAGLEKHMELAKLAVEETRRGVYEDKII